MKFAAISGALKRSFPRMNAGAPTQEKGDGHSNCKDGEASLAVTKRWPATALHIYEKKGRAKSPGPISQFKICAADYSAVQTDFTSV
jgi:hypothetical protein